MPTMTAQIEGTAVRIPIGNRVWLTAEIVTPPDAKGLVLFAHGSGSIRFSSRNQYVASELNYRRIGTLLADLLTPDEGQLDEQTGALLTERLVKLIDWTEGHEIAGTLPIGLFGASDGAAAALDAAAERPAVVDAVVCRGGRADLAKQLRGVRAPTLLIVGGNDREVVEANSAAMKRLTCRKQLEVIPGATHLFQEPGALEAVSGLAGAWFDQYLNGA